MSDRPEIAAPDSITLSADRAWLSAAWPDGRHVRLHAGPLRAACRCGFCVRAQVDGRPPRTDGITIVAVEAHGPHVGRLVFSDGHDRGLYPWSYLLEIAAAEAAPADMRP